jgi:hypothetical protein
VKLNERQLQVRRKIPQAPTTFYDNKPQYTSEPHLSDENESLPQQHQPARRNSTRRIPQQSNQSAYAPGKNATFYFINS